jgi:hypothetical protein
VIDRPGSGGGIGTEDEETTIRLLRLAGTRAEVQPSRQARVKRAFLDECRAVARARVLRRRTLVAAGSLAAAAAIVIAIRPGSPRPTAVPDRPIVATVERIEGGSARLMAGSANPVEVRRAQHVRPGDWVETGAEGRAAVRLEQGASVRLDRASRARFLSATTLELASGALYVDTGPASPKLEIRTDLGTVRDVGTQFEVRRDASALRVRVRSGVVEVRRGHETSSARPGTQVVIDSRGVVTGPFAPFGPEWAWAATLAPDFETEACVPRARLDADLRRCDAGARSLGYDPARIHEGASAVGRNCGCSGDNGTDIPARERRTSGCQAGRALIPEVARHEPHPGEHDEGL